MTRYVDFFDPITGSKKTVHVGELTKGRVVQGVERLQDGCKAAVDEKYGYLEGFGTNPQGELILKVEFGGLSSYVHPTNLILC